MRFLLEKFPSLAALKHFAPVLQSTHPVPKSLVVPMKILPNDGKYIEENIKILQRFQRDAELSNNPEVLESFRHSKGKQLHVIMYTTIFTDCNR